METTILDCNGKRLEVGTRVIDPDTRMEGGTVTGLTEPDGDVNEHGRPVARGPYVKVLYDDGSSDTWVATWNATGPWDDSRTDYTCDDVEIAPTQLITPDTKLGWFR